MAKKQAKFSMRPEMAEEGIFGNNVDVTIAEALYCTWDDAGEDALKGGREANDPCAKISFETEDGSSHVQYFSAGKGTRLCPSEDGEEPAESGPFIMPTEDSPAKGLNKQSNAYHLLNSLCKPASGKLKLDSHKLDEVGLKALEGIRCHLVRVPSPNQGSFVQEEGAQPRTIIVVNEIYELGKGGGKGTAAKGKPGPKAVKAAKEEEEGDSDSDDMTTEAQTMVVKALAKAGDDGIVKDKLVKAIFAAAAKSANRKEILAMVQEEDFITEGPWLYDEESETLTSAE